MNSGLRHFRPLFVMAVLMLIGIGLLPLLDTAIDPRPSQGKTLTITYNWPGASAKVMEQNATSVIEGLVSSVRGVAKTESQSRFGFGSVIVELKSGADVSAVKFEIASLLRQMRDKLPEGMSQPIVSGGEIVNDGNDDRKTVTLLTYQLADNLSTNELREYVKNRLEPLFMQVDGITGIEVNGATDRYLEVTFDPEAMAQWGITSTQLRQAVALYLGEEATVGEVEDNGRRIAVWLATDGMDKELEHIPIRSAEKGATVYLNDLARCTYKYKNPEKYYRVNGLNTVYLDLKAESGSNLISLSDHVQEEIESITSSVGDGVKLTLSYDAAQRQRDELGKLVSRSLLSLLILLTLVLIVSRSWRYLAVITITLGAALVISVIGYYVFDIRLHIYSLAGITVSLGLVIDATIVMTDHYQRYRDRGAYFGILAALLTTIGSLVLIVFMPEYIRKDLLDFAWIVMINLTSALIVAYFFVPPLVEVIGKTSVSSAKPHATRKSDSKLYSGYISWGHRHRWVIIVVLVLAFGLPIFALPGDWRFPYRKEVSKWLGGTLTLFAESLDSRTYSTEKPELKLHVRARLPQGGTASQLNEKVLQLDEFLKGQDGIKRWVTTVNKWGANIDIEFTDEALESSLPYMIENKVIGRVIDIGGADWATYGVSERGFSNSLNLSFRSHDLLVSGYNYERLTRLAEALLDTLARSPRVTDIIIRAPGQRQQEEEEFYAVVDRELMASDDLAPNVVHSALRDMLMPQKVGVIDDGKERVDVIINPATQNVFDMWQLANTYVRTDSADVRAGALMSIDKRKAKNIIDKRNQEYVLSVAFNILGSSSYSSKFIKSIVENFNNHLPVGFKCEIATYGWYEDTGEQYWLLGMVIVVIYFICGILFESWTRPLAILSLVPVAFIGVFLAFWLTGVPFGTGGFASLVLLCGLVVNAAIYILCEYDTINAQSPPAIKSEYISNYVMAFRRKIGAVVLTVVSTVAGLTPFLFDGPEEKFWFSFALGSIAGLLFSLIALVLCLPVFLRFPTKSKP